MAPLWARAKVQTDARPRVVVQIAGSNAGWLDRLSARPDVLVEKIAPAAPLVRAARDARLVVLVAALPFPSAGEEAAMLTRIREVKGEAPQIPVVVVLDVADGTSDAAVSAARVSLFGGGATDVVFLPGDADRVEEAVSQFAGITARRFVRHRVRLAATVGDAGGTAQVENLSAGGVQMRTTPAPALGSVLRLSLPLEKRAPLECWGVVRNVVPTGSGAVARLRFVGMRPAERAKLEAFLGSLDADTRSTEPADAIAGVRRLDEHALRAAVADPVNLPDWLAASLPALADAERRALSGAGAGATATVWASVAVARTQSAALADALEKYDPSLDGEPPAIRETVTIVFRKLRAARADLAAVAPGDAEAARIGTEMSVISERLERAVSARLPDLAAAWESSGGRAGSAKDLGLPDGTVRHFTRPALRKRLLAAGAGLLLGAVIVYTVVVFLSRTR